ncbi:MAG: hypothetical protein P8080_03390 [Gammaproteobacteria bacterium]
MGTLPEEGSAVGGPVSDHSPSGRILEKVEERSTRRVTPRIVRNWIAPMVMVVAVALLFSTVFYMVDLFFMDGAVTGAAGVFEHYLAFTPELITDALPALGTTIVAALGIVLTVIAIIVQLSSERYTSVAMMFLRDPVHVAVLSFYVVASLCAVWLSVTLRVDFVPRSLLLLVMTLTSLGLATMLPYFAYTFWFLEPGNIIERLRLRSSRIARAGLASESAEDVERLQERLVLQMEEITDIANNSIEGRDKIIAADAVNGLRDFLLHYIAHKEEGTPLWFRTGEALRASPDFTGMDTELLTELSNRGLWVEWKTLREFERVFHEALDSMEEIATLVAIDTRYLGEVAAQRGHSDSLRMVFRFLNSYIRAAVEAGSSRTACDVLHQYRMLLEELLRLGDADAACEGVAFIKYYGQIAFEEDLPSVTETVAYDVAALCQYAHRRGLKGEVRILRQLLNLDAEGPTEGYRQQRSLRGVRRAQTKLAVYYLSAGAPDKARLIAEDMRDMPPSLLEGVRDDLVQAPPPHFWEIVDRGRNLHYLKDDERQQLDTFLGWLETGSRPG